MSDPVPLISAPSAVVWTLSELSWYNSTVPFFIAFKEISLYLASKRISPSPLILKLCAVFVKSIRESVPS